MKQSTASTSSIESTSFAIGLKPRKCVTCRGRGWMPGLAEESAFTCPDCVGTGEDSTPHPSRLTPHVQVTAEAAC
jgi:DnaJ-class molecular chaperone